MIPKLHELGSDVFTHRHNDIFNPPGLTNFIGTVQVDLNPVAIRSVNFPPYGSGDSVTAALFLNGRYWPSLGSPVNIQWFPDKVVRRSEWDGIELLSTTVLPFDVNAALIRIDVTNKSGSSRPVGIKLGVTGYIAKAVRPWNTPMAPGELDNGAEPDFSRNAVVHAAKHSDAAQIQGMIAPDVQVRVQAGHLAAEIALDPSKSENTFVNRSCSLATELNLEPGQTETIWYLTVTGESVGDVSATYDRIAADPQAAMDAVRRRWEHEIEAIFTADNDIYSGALPVLETSDEGIRRMYHMAILGVTYFRRDNPFSTYGRAYDTLMPRYWQTVTFIWDYALSGLVHALLDPAVMTKYMETWLKMDVHQHFGTEYLTGAPVGPWYAVNDYAITSLMRDYLRWSGDTAWLDKPMTLADGSQKPAFDMLKMFAHNYRGFQTPNGLADYGGLNNLLECVSTYIHEVASLNAANVFNLRYAAEVSRFRGDAAGAQALLDEADQLLERVQTLYADGKGFWHTRFPDNQLVEVRHVYDFITVLNTIGDALSDKQKSEMTRFFVEELQTPTWMRALSDRDDNSMFSVRTDHQWNGSYPAWPAQSVTGLYKIGQHDLAFDWLKGLCKTANQGPFGQAHFTETVVKPENGAATKASPDLPWINDWICSSNGSWANVVIEAIFGVKAGLDGIEAHPQFSSFDPDAVLRGLKWQGKTFDVTRKGLQQR